MLKKLEISGFKSFAKKTTLSFDTPITAIVGPNGSGKSNVVESIRFVLGEQSIKSLRGKGGSDMIWKGSKLLGPMQKGRVAITFDNSARQFAFSNSSGAPADLSFDEITLVREVSMDGGSSYSINGSSVRLKDITELLGSVNIGTTGHHIISQGEADRLLSATAKDRRGMVEDALGLKVHQVRIRESERKLEKTALNMKEVQALRRELAPHLSFLGKQVEKIQKTEELRTEFSDLFTHYVAGESASLLHAESVLRAEEHQAREALRKAQAEAAPNVQDPFMAERAAAQARVRECEQKQSDLARSRDDLGRALGRIEGKLDALSVTVPVSGPSAIATSRVEALCNDIVATISEAESTGDVAILRTAFSNLKNKVQTFIQSLRGQTAPVDTTSIKAQIEAERASLEAQLRDIEQRAQQASLATTEARAVLAGVEQKSMDAQRSSFTALATIATLEGTLRECMLRTENVARRKAVLADEVREALALAGGPFPYAEQAMVDTVEMAAERESLHRKLERVKIKLEDAGAASGAEVLKEYEETKERDAFLLRELTDLESSITALRTLIAELRDTIERAFKEGVEKINAQFGEYFKLMFGGGSAFLSISVEHRRQKEDEEPVDTDELPFEHGIEINVSLPHKKVRDLHMLSGGERSLVSIALLFAMSQVNPPPFLVLDETDAALDEANSRKYGNMLDLLSNHSKLIVVTHNRETMSRAQVLYGVTMGVEGASKLLSIKFDEAVQIAK